MILCRKLGTVRQTEWIRAWAYRVATRASFRALRRARRDRVDLFEDLSEIPDTAEDESEIDADKLLAELPTTIARLPAAAQVVVRLHYLESLTQQEIAEALEVPIGTVKSRLAYGLMCLRKVWAP
jgi:RNA polymerase sigma-70 factor (ECF subfamily)